jgi:hypothetical protein
MPAPHLPSLCYVLHDHPLSELCHRHHSHVAGGRFAISLVQYIVSGHGHPSQLALQFSATSVDELCASLGYFMATAVLARASVLPMSTFAPLSEKLLSVQLQPLLAIRM